MNNQFIDLHCHSTLKPYSKSFKIVGHEGQNNANIKKEESVWFINYPRFIDKITNTFLSVTKFTQADFKASFNGGVKVMMVSIDPMEVGLVFNKRGKPPGLFGRLLKNFVMGIGAPRIKYLLNLTNYYSELHRSCNYLEQLNNTFVEFDGGKQVTYKLVDKYTDIDLNQNDTLHIVLTIEGAHVFNTGLEFANVITDANEVINNIRDMKSNSWKVKPFFISLAHHFPNQLCGQAQSFKGISKLNYNQRLDKNSGITVLGKAVINELLDTSNGQKRIYIDVKHMNLKSRHEYFHLLKTDVTYQGEGIPIIVSHGCANFKNKPAENNNEINFYNEEILEVAHSGGIFGIQLDERRLIKKKPPIKARRVEGRPKRLLYKKSYYVWHQIKGIALLLYGDPTYNGDPWGLQALGSDFDGIVDPLNGYWTHSEYRKLAHHLRLHAGIFLKSKRAQNLPGHSQLDAVKIVEKFLFGNAQAFMKKYLI